MVATFVALLLVDYDVDEYLIHTDINNATINLGP